MEIILGTTFHQHAMASLEHFVNTNEIECDIKNYSGCVIYDIDYYDFHDFIDDYFQIEGTK